MHPRATLEVPGRGTISTYESASKEEFNVMRRPGHAPAVKALADDLWQQRRSIEALTRQHLGLGKADTCIVLDLQQWVRGGCNMFVLLTSSLADSLESTVDEKLGCEVRAYVWMQENCAHVRIPRLYGFGFSDDRHFTHTRHWPFFSRISRVFWRFVYGLLGYPVLSQYVRTTSRHRIPCAYMLLEHIDSGQMLSTTWDKHRACPARRWRLFCGISNIMLSLARLPQPRIGAFEFHNDGTITLRNRPMSCPMVLLENDGAPRTMQRNDTYNCTDSFVSDMLTFYDHRFLSQPNAVYSENDCRGQMAVMTLLRVFSHRYVKREHRHGPFPLQLTDLHASNIFVGDDWNITCLVDLEWLCALPREMLSVPYWIIGCSIDEIQDERYADFDDIRLEFMRVLDEQEARAEHQIELPQAMQEMWGSKGGWFWYCLSSVNAMYFLLEGHLCPPRSLSTSAERAVSQFWCENPETVVQAKLADREEYDAELKRVFGE